MKKLFCVLVAFLLASVGIFAQAAPTGAGPNHATTTTKGIATTSGIMEYTTKGVFALRDGVLVKFNPKTLTLDGTLELFGPAPKLPEGDMRANPELFRPYFAEMAKRAAPAILIPKDNSLIIVIGTWFFRIDQDTLTLETPASDFAGPDDAAAAGGGRGFQNAQPPLYLFSDKALVLLRSKELVALNTKDGTPMTRTPLPTQMTTPPPNYNFGRGPGGGGNRGGGNRGGGNRGGGGGGNPGGGNPAPPAQ